MMQEYKIVDELYHGERSKILLSSHLRKKTKYIFKTHVNPYPSNETIDRIRHEYDMVEQVNSNHVTKYLAIREYDKGIFLVRESNNYISLQEYLVRHVKNKRLTIIKFLDIAIQLAQGLTDIHQCEIIHNDIHSKNILINVSNNLVKYTDFALSSLRKSKATKNYITAHTRFQLSYISPEKTGRIHQHIGPRSDLYSLGVVYYQLLTGRTPFEGDEPIAMIQSHIAKIPIGPIHFNKNIPQILNDLVIILLNKDPTKRYQSSINLFHDLVNIQKCITSSSLLSSVRLTHHECQPVFNIPPKLYGRDQQVQELKEALHRINPKGMEVVLVSGYSGIGKTSLIQAIREDLINRSGHYIIGKFVQNQQVVFSALNQAFQGLIKEILSKSDDAIEYWKNRIMDAIGTNGQIITNVIPDVESIIGRQCNVDILSPVENEIRFNKVFLDFLSVFSNVDHPLVLFLDDIQWADSGTINFLHQLSLTDKQISLLIIGAYRDNEIHFNKHAKRFLKLLENSNTPIRRIKLDPLSITNICHLLMDTFNMEISAVKELADVIYEKTGGNPFFIKSLLTYLYSEDKIFLLRNNQWAWDIKQIREEKVSDNIAEFILNRVNRLSKKAQKILAVASCVGNRFQLNIIARILNEDPQDILKSLRLAVKYDLIMYVSENFYFSHDKILEAAKLKLSNEDRASMHVRIAKLMVSDCKDKHELLDIIYGIVDHLNHGLDYFECDKDRLLLIDLNQKAGYKAKLSAAYKNARNYYNIANQLLTDSDWDCNYKLTYQVTEGLAESEYVNKDIESANRYCQILLKHGKNIVDKANAYNMLIQHYVHLSMVDEAVDTAKQCLTSINMNIPLNPAKYHLLKEYVLLKYAFVKYRHKIDILKDFKVNSNSTVNIFSKTFYALWDLAHNTGKSDLIFLLAMRTIRLSLQYGMLDETVGALLLFATCLNWKYNNNNAFFYEKLALSLNNFNFGPSVTGKFLFPHLCYLLPWRQSWHTLPDLLHKAISESYKSGILTFVVYYANQAMFYEPLLNLNEAEHYFSKYIQISNDINHKQVRDSYYLHRQLWISFINDKSNRLNFSTPDFCEYSCLSRMKSIQYKSGIACYYLFKLIISFDYDDYENAELYYKLSKENINALLGLPLYVDFKLLEILIYLQKYYETNLIEKISIKNLFNKTLKVFKRWSDNCIENFYHLQCIVKAEYSHKVKKICDYKQYDLAINHAQVNKLYRYAGLYAQLAAKAALANNHTTIANAYFEKAIYIYQLWGAYAKVNYIKDTYLSTDYSLYGANFRYNSSKSESIFLNYDLNAVISSSQAISSETSFEDLAKKIIHIIVQHACVQKCYMIMQEENMSLTVSAYTDDGKLVNIEKSPLNDKKDQLAVTVINYVKHSRRNVLRYNNEHDDMFSSDAYLKNKNPHFIFCMPIIKNKKLIAILYLENYLSENTFTKERLEILEILAAQVAISLDTTLYFQRKAEQQIKKHQLELAHYSKLATTGETISSIAHEINQPLSAIVQYSGVCVEKLYATSKDNSVISMMELVEREAERAGAIIHRLKDFLKKDKLKKSLVDINDSINAILSLLSPRLKQSNIICNLVLEHTLPIILADRMQLEQVLFNLLMNAIESIELATNNLRYINIKTKYVTSHIHILIEDNGLGIDDEIKDKILNPFFSTKKNGMGMGLNICRTIVENHRGQFIFSSCNSETLFEIILPGGKQNDR